MRTVTGVVAMAVVVALLAASASVMRLSVYRIVSGSMEPVLPVGAVVVTSAAVPIMPGRAVTFETAGNLVTHVLMGYHPDGSLLTRGIANRTDDDWRVPVRSGDVRGTVVAGILLFAPSFWVSVRGLVAVIGFAVFLAAIRVSMGR